MTEKPSWDDAPEWAQWLAQDGGGCWVWFDRRPYPRADWQDWWGAPDPRSRIHVKRGDPNPDWRDTLEKRPEPKPSRNASWQTSLVVGVEAAQGQQGLLLHMPEPLDAGEYTVSVTLTPVKPPEPELKPCPFCGGKDVHVESWLTKEPPQLDMWRVKCHGCVAMTANYNYRHEAIEAWNRRVA